jgi:hypothetical protein
MIKNRLISVSWVIFRLIILNLIIVLIALLIGYLKQLFEPIVPFMIRFPVKLYILTVMLANLIYLIGNVFEIIYLKIWNKDIQVKEFEKKFFKAGLMMILIVNTFGIIQYFINYFA